LRGGALASATQPLIILPWGLAAVSWLQ